MACPDLQAMKSEGGLCYIELWVDKGIKEKNSPPLKWEKMEKDINMWKEAVEDTAKYPTRNAVADECDHTWRGMRRNLHEQVSLQLNQYESDIEAGNGSSVLAILHFLNLRGTVDFWILARQRRLILKIAFLLLVVFVKKKKNTKHMAYSQ